MITKSLPLQFIRLCILMLPISVNLAELQKWTASNGREIEASFVALEGQTLRLEDQEGVIREIKLDQLSPESRITARRIASSSWKALDGSSRRVLHQHRTPQYHLQILEDQGWGLLQILHQDKPLHPQPIVLRLAVGRYVNQRYTGVPVKSVHPPQIMAKSMVRWTAELESDGSVEIELRLGPDEISIGYQVLLDPTSPSEVIQTTLRAEFPATVVSDEATPLIRLAVGGDPFEREEIPKRIPNHKLQLRRSTVRRQQTYPFWESVGEAFTGQVERAVVEGLYAPYTLGFRLPARGATGSLWIYGGGSPSGGFSLNMVKDNPADVPHLQMLTLSLTL